MILSNITGDHRLASVLCRSSLPATPDRFDVRIGWPCNHAVVIWWTHNRRSPSPIVSTKVAPDKARLLSRPLASSAMHGRSASGPTPRVGPIGMFITPRHRFRLNTRNYFNVVVWTQLTAATSPSSLLTTVLCPQPKSSSPLGFSSIWVYVVLLVWSYSAANLTCLCYFFLSELHIG